MMGTTQGAAPAAADQLLNLVGLMSDPAKLAAQLAELHQATAEFDAAKAAALVTYGGVSEASAQWPSEAFPGGVIKMPLKYQNEKWASGPHADNRMAHEVAHTCGADERTARSVANAWWPVEAGWNGGLE